MSQIRARAESCKVRSLLPSSSRHHFGPREALSQIQHCQGPPERPWDLCSWCSVPATTLGHTVAALAPSALMEWTSKGASGSPLNMAHHRDTIETKRTRWAPARALLCTQYTVGMAGGTVSGGQYRNALAPPHGHRPLRKRRLAWAAEKVGVFVRARLRARSRLAAATQPSIPGLTPPTGLDSKATGHGYAAGPWGTLEAQALKLQST
jgi:hypothetical protein